MAVRRRPAVGRWVAEKYRRTSNTASVQTRLTDFRARSGERVDARTFEAVRGGAVVHGHAVFSWLVLR